ncbi:hypothetical protein [Mycolicibacterium sp. CR10]|uniref:hypothetical protein n=1 Tax=Mycolicibacterium sp. CR10 TaxID=2562314 RepID=UPI0010C12940
MESGDLEPRVEALENQVHDLTGRVQGSERDAAAARVLAGAADRDVSEFRSEIRDFRRATAASFNAMRQDFVDLRQEFVDLRHHVDQRFAQVDQGFTEMRGKFDAVAAGQQQIVDLLHGMIRGQGGGTPAG